MIVRIWHGWTAAASADDYERLLRSEVLPGIHRIDGYLGVVLLRRQEEHDEVEFVTLTFWRSLDALRAFAGSDHEVAVVPDEARMLLSRFDERSAHYDMLPVDLGARIEEAAAERGS